MSTDGNKQYFTDLTDKNLGQAFSAQDELRKIRNTPAGHTRAEIAGHIRDAKDSLDRAGDALGVLVDVDG